MLGGVTCSFKKEIKPFEPYEIWTRVLSWDHKWLYLVSHVAKRGATKPTSYSLQPWRKVQIGQTQQCNGKDPQSAIFATSIAKYVFKQGRRTVPPEDILTMSDLLPLRPTDVKEKQVIQDPSAPHPSSNSSSIPDENESSIGPVVGSIDRVAAREIDEWDWDRVEHMRASGMEIASLMAGLDAAHDAFTAAGIPALGQF